MSGHTNLGAPPGSRPGRPRLVHSGEVQAEIIDVWLFDTDADLDPDTVDPSILDDHERSRAAALEQPDLRRRYLLAHAALRHFLGRALGLPPQDVRIVREACPRCGAAGGRPVLADWTRSLYFSLSSSDHLLLIGLASASVGVDVEAIPTLRTVTEASELLHPAERQELVAMAPKARQASFTQLWTRKEAFLKGTGVGVGHGLEGAYLGTRSHAATPEGWTLIDVSVSPGFRASAALLTS